MRIILKRLHSYGQWGKPKAKGTSVFKNLRLKRHRKYAKAAIFKDQEIEVQKKNLEGRWVSLGYFRTEAEAIEILEYEGELMKYIEAIKNGGS